MMPVSDSDLIFSHWDGSPLLPNSITQAWRRVAHRCGLDGIYPHTARHSHASLLLKQGVHPKIVQERLGHAGIGITLDLYSHVAPGLQQAAANKFDDFVLPKVKQEN
jgi:integrase